jgi:ribosomal protein S18 acetylase RimI-like enzyme
MATQVIDKPASIRPLRREDIAELAEAVAEEASLAQIEARWREQELGYREILVAEVEGRVVGTVSMYESAPGTMHLFALEVGAEWRNRGIGRALVERVIEEARRRGLGRVYLEVRVDNRARRLYHRVGFRRVGQPFMNGWWRYDDWGGRERVEEVSLRMVKRLRPVRAGAAGPVRGPGGKKS